MKFHWPCMANFATTIMVLGSVSNYEIVTFFIGVNIQYSSLHKCVGEICETLSKESTQRKTVYGLKILHPVSYVRTKQVWMYAYRNDHILPDT